jgi:hypothetical protein
LQGTEALQFGFKTAGRNPEVHKQQLRDTKYSTTPLLRATKSHYARGCFLHTLTIMPGMWDKKAGFKRVSVPWFSG